MPPSTESGVARAERALHAGVVAIAAALFSSTVSGNVHFGDSAESAAGVGSLGILHAPGYVAWVGLARLFSELVPIGGLALRVALFSVVCASATVGVVFAIARRLGASPAGAAIGALSLAASSSFWFYAGYAKAYALTSFLIALTVWCLITWSSSGTRWRLAVAGLAMGLSLGAAWQSMAVAAPGLALLLVAYDRRPRVRDLSVLAASGLAAAGGVVGWVMVRASADPAVTWGGASTPGRAIRLLLMRDFINLQGTGAGTARGQSVASGDNLSAFVVKVLRIPLFLTAEYGIAVLAVLVVGAAVAVRSSRTSRWWALLVIYLANVAAVFAIISPGRRPRSAAVSREALLRTGGFTLAAGIVLACLVALGATWALERAGTGTAVIPSRRRSRETSAQRRARQAASATRARRPWLGQVVAGAVLLGTAGYHWSAASHHEPPFAADYGYNVLTSLPDDTVLLTNLLERSFTVEYQQVVRDLRPDVELVQIEKLASAWYREDVGERLGIDFEGGGDRTFELGLAVTDQLSGQRPVYYDASALSSLVSAREDLAYRAVGLVAEALPTGGGQSFDADATARLLEGYRLDGLFDDPARLRYPNARMLTPYVTTLSDLGVALAQEERFPEARHQLERALQIAPDDETATDLLRQLDVLEGQQRGGAERP